MTDIFDDRLDDGAHQYMQYAVTGALRIEDLLRGLREYWQVSEVNDRTPTWTICDTVLDRVLHVCALADGGHAASPSTSTKAEKMRCMS